MIWVAQELMVWLVLAFVLGLAAGVLLSVTRVTVERWVEVPVPPGARDEKAEEETETEVVEAEPAVEQDPVFPTLEGEAPWQQEEAWSRPATPVRTATRSSGPVDEWDDAGPKVEAALGCDDILALIHAADTADNGKRKLAAALQRNTGGKPGEIAVIDTFTGVQLDLALSRPNVVHAALLAGSGSETFLARVVRLTRFRTGFSTDAVSAHAPTDGA